MTLRAGSRVYRLGDSIRVRVARAEVATGRIDMELAEGTPKQEPSETRSRRPAGDRKPRSASGKRSNTQNRPGKRSAPDRRGNHRGKSTKNRRGK